MRKTFLIIFVGTYVVWIDFVIDCLVSLFYIIDFLIHFLVYVVSINIPMHFLVSISN